MARTPVDRSSRRSTMTPLEKRLVNSRRKGRAVARRLETLLADDAPPPGARYLDVGCGNGEATRAVAAAYGLAATGVDLDPAQIALARSGPGAGGSICFLAADATRLPFPDESFDVVTSSKATHHIPAWRDAMAEMERVLRLGGRLVYADLAAPRPLAWLVGRVTGHDPPTRAALDAALAALGLEVVYRRVTSVGYEAVLQKL